MEPYRQNNPYGVLTVGVSSYGFIGAINGQNAVAANPSAFGQFSSFNSPFGNKLAIDANGPFGRLLDNLGIIVAPFGAIPDAVTPLSGQNI